MSTLMSRQPDPKDGPQEQAAANGAASDAHSAPTGPTSQMSQAERAAMHPEHQDPDWRYYSGAWKM